MPKWKPEDEPLMRSLKPGVVRQEGRSRLGKLLREVSACEICAADLPTGPRPVVRVHREARILIAGQAPGRLVHESGLPFDDPSGDRLRDWLGVERATFYDERRLAIVPMGFCYPGTGQGGDLPPRPECAATWHERILRELPNVELKIVLGAYALDYHLGEKGSVAGAVERWREHWPHVIPLPHPSPRNIRWFREHPWFEAEVVPALRERVATLLGEHP